MKKKEKKKEKKISSQAPSSTKILIQTVTASQWAETPCWSKELPAS